MTSNILIYLPQKQAYVCKYDNVYLIVAIETPSGKRNLNMNINAQQVILNAYISNNSSLCNLKKNKNKE